VQYEESKDQEFKVINQFLILVLDESIAMQLSQQVVCQDGGSSQTPIAPQVEFIEQHQGELNRTSPSIIIIPEVPPTKKKRPANQIANDTEQRVLLSLEETKRHNLKMEEYQKELIDVVKSGIKDLVNAIKESNSCSKDLNSRYTWLYSVYI